MANLAKAAEVLQPAASLGNVAATVAPVPQVDPTVAQIDQVLSYADIVAPIVGSFNPAVGAGLKMAEGVAKLVVPSIVAGYKEIEKAFKATAPANVSIEQWADQLRKDAIAMDPELLMKAAENALGVPQGIYGPGPADGPADVVKDDGLPAFLAHLAPSR